MLNRISEGLESSGITVTAENLATSNFCTTFSEPDLAQYRAFLDGGPRWLPTDVLAQQQILEASDVLVVVFPVHWWSLPAQLKGWMDRVLTGGWAWGIRRSGRTTSEMTRLTVYLVPLAGTESEYFDEHGYRTAMETQIEQGIFGYTHTRRTTWTWMWNAARHPQKTLQEADKLAQSIARDLSRGDHPSIPADSLNHAR